MLPIKFKNKKLFVQFERYTNDNVCIDVVDKFGECYLTATTNLGFKLDSNLVIIKNYSENEGIKECLILHNIISTEIKVIDNLFTLHKIKLEKNSSIKMPNLIIEEIVRN